MDNVSLMCIDETWINGLQESGCAPRWNDNQMANYNDALKVMEAVARYRKDGNLPDDPHEIDRLCERLFSDDGFDEVAIEWKRISNYEREVHGGDWPKAD